MSASIIESLVISGSRKSDGSANASGKVWAYLPNTSTKAQLYSDVDGTLVLTQPLVLDAGGLVPRATAPDGVFTAIPIRLYIEDADGVVVADTLFTPATASTVSVDNDATTASDVDEYITKVQTSTGGADALYLESAGATARTIKSKFSEIWISVKDFGAVGDGVAIDTTAIQAAVNRVKALGGGVVYFPPGEYLKDQSLVLTGQDGVSFVGAGVGATTIKDSNATANGFTISSCNGFKISGMTMVNSAVTVGVAISLSSCSNVTIENFKTDDDALTNVGSYRYPIRLDSCSSISIDGSLLYARGADANARGMVVTDSSYVTAKNSTFEAGAGAGRYSLEFTGTTTKYLSLNVNHGSPVRFAAALTGRGFTFVGGSFDSTVPMSIATATQQDIRVFGVEAGDGYSDDVASGGTFTPNLAFGRYIRCRITSTGAAVTIAAPSPPPEANMRGFTIVLDIFNNAGGALSNPTVMNAAYHLATAPNQTDLNHNVYTLLWDPDASVWRQLSLSVTT